MTGKDVAIFDSPIAVALQLKERLNQLNLPNLKNVEGETIFYSSADSANLLQTIATLWADKICYVRILDSTDKNNQYNLFNQHLEIH